MKPKSKGFSVAAILAALSAAATARAADVKLPQASPAATVTQLVGLNEMKIAYHRPGVKGRKIWGALVPYGKVWRTGANEATAITFGEDVTVGGKDVPAGTYMLATIPAEEEWTVILNKDAKQWGAFEYKEGDDLVRLKVKPAAAPFEERMSFRFEDPEPNSVRVVLHWEMREIAFTVSNRIDTNTQVLKNLRDAIASAAPDDWRILARAANFCRENKVDLEEANAWIDKSIKIKETALNHFVKAEMLEQEGRTREAVAEAEKALKVVTPEDEKGFTDEIRRMIGDWKAKTK
jgi:hypothetical protein